MTFVHHCLSMVRMTLICLLLRIARRSSWCCCQPPRPALGREVGEQGLKLGTAHCSEPAAVLEQTPSQSLQHRIVILVVAPGEIECVGGVGDDMEPVAGYGGVRHMPPDALDIGRGHVDADCADRRWIAGVGGEIRGQALNRLRLTGLGDKDRLSALGIGSNRPVGVSPDSGGLVNSQLLPTTRTSCQPHLPVQPKHQRFKEQAKARQFAGPRWRDASHRAVRQFHPWYADFEKALLLEKSQIPVVLGLRVKDRMAPRGLRMAQAAAAVKIHPDGQRMRRILEARFAFVPRCFNTQHRLEQPLLRNCFTPVVKHNGYLIHLDFKRANKNGLFSKLFSKGVEIRRLTRKVVLVFNTLQIQVAQDNIFR